MRLRVHSRVRGNLVGMPCLLDDALFGLAIIIWIGEIYCLSYKKVRV